MKRIKINDIHLLNFKGARDVRVVFHPDAITEIYGDNGVGKSTIVDAFCWLLFGKDAKDKKDFSIKTRERGEVIPRIPHEVSALITIDGDTIYLKRSYNEKWTKTKGEATEHFAGHEEERLFNNVPCSLKDWKEKVANICDEEVFKFITNPLYFATRKEDAQRALLFKMAGGVEDKEIAKGNKDYTELLNNLSGKTMEEYKKEIAAKKRIAKADVDSIPSRIDERKRDISATAVSTADDEKELAQKEKALAEVETELADESKAYQAAANERLTIVKQIEALKYKRSQIEASESEKLMADYNKAAMTRQEKEFDVRDITSKIEHCVESLKYISTRLSEVCQKREKLIADYKRIMAEINNAANAPMDESTFVCPTCGRRYEPDEIEAKRADIIQHYLDGKVKEKEANLKDGLEIKALKEKLEAVRKETEDNIAALETKRGSITAEIALLKVPNEKPDVKQHLMSCSDIIAIDKEIAELEAKAGEAITPKQDAELAEAKEILKSSIDELKTNIAIQKRVAEENEKNNARIVELEKQLTASNEELAQLEKIEFTIQNFSKARSRAIESQINSLFSYVRFQLFEQQVNGAEVECCIPLVNGVPFSDANTAGQVNAGLDIINAIVMHTGISAPIFIDGAESINNFIAVESQVVKLIVSHDKELVVKADKKEQTLF